MQLGSVWFPLLLAIAASVGRDGIRRGCLRATTAAAAAASALACLPLAAAAITAAAGVFWWSTSSLMSQEHAHYTEACAMYLAALLIEACTLPAYVLTVYRGEVVVESAVEVLARAADAALFWGSVRLPAVRSLAAVPKICGRPSVCSHAPVKICAALPCVLMLQSTRREKGMPCWALSLRCPPDCEAFALTLLCC